MEAQRIIVRDFQPEAPYKTSAEHTQTCGWRKRLVAAEEQAFETSQKLGAQELGLERARETVARLEQDLMGKLAIHDDQRNPHGRKRLRPSEDQAHDPVYLDFASNNLMAHLNKHEQMQTTNKTLSYQNAQLEQKLERAKNALKYAVLDRDGQILRLQSTNAALTAHNQVLLADSNEAKQQEINELKQRLAKVQAAADVAAEESELEHRGPRQELLNATFDLECSRRLADSQAFELKRLQPENALLKQDLADQEAAAFAKTQVILNDRNQLLDDADDEIRYLQRLNDNLRASSEKMAKDVEESQQALAMSKQQLQLSNELAEKLKADLDIARSAAAEEAKRLRLESKTLRQSQKLADKLQVDLNVAQSTAAEDANKLRLVNRGLQRKLEDATRKTQTGNAKLAKSPEKGCEECSRTRSRHIDDLVRLNKELRQAKAAEKEAKAHEKEARDARKILQSKHETDVQQLEDTIADQEARLRTHESYSEQAGHSTAPPVAEADESDEELFPDYANSSPRQQFAVPILDRRERMVYAQPAREIIQDDLSRPATTQRLDEDSDSEADEFYDAA